MKTIQIIYFDPDDASMDGCGWNVVDNGSFATRYATAEDAVALCRRLDLPFILLDWEVSMKEALNALVEQGVVLP